MSDWEVLSSGTVQEIQTAIVSLSLVEYRELERWWEAHQEQLWDAQLLPAIYIGLIGLDVWGVVYHLRHNLGL